MMDGQRQYAPALVCCCDRCKEPLNDFPKGPNEPLLVFCRECVDDGDISVYGYEGRENSGYWNDGFLGPTHEY